MSGAVVRWHTYLAKELSAMIQRMTGKRLNARAQFGSLLLAGLLTGTSSAQMPSRLGLPNATSLPANSRSLAPPSLEYMPSVTPAGAASSTANSAQPHKSVANWLGINRQAQTLPAVGATDNVQAAGLPELPAHMRGAIRQVGHEGSQSTTSPAVVHAHSTQTSSSKVSTDSQAAADSKVVTGSNVKADSKSEEAIVGGPVPALPMESLLDVDLSKHTITAPPAAELSRSLPAAPTAAPPTRVQIHETFAPKTDGVYSPRSSGTFHLSDEDEPKSDSDAFPIAKAAPPRLPVIAPTSSNPTMSPVAQSTAAGSNAAGSTTVRANAPAKLNHPTAVVEPMATTDKPTQPEVAPSGPQAKTPVAVGSVASSSSQRPISLRIGNSKMTAESPSTRVFEQRSLSSPSPIINAQPVVRVVKPITPTEMNDEQSPSKPAFTLASGSNKLPTSTTAYASAPAPAKSSAVKSSATAASNGEPLVMGEPSGSQAESKAAASSQSKSKPSSSDTAASTSVAATSASPASAAPASSLTASSLRASASPASVTPAVASTKEPTASGDASKQALVTAAAKTTAADGASSNTSPESTSPSKLLALETFEVTERPVDPAMATELNRRIKQMFPDSHVEVKTDDEGLVVDGVAASNAEAGKILALVRRASLCPVSDRVITKR